MKKEERRQENGDRRTETGKVNPGTRNIELKTSNLAVWIFRSYLLLLGITIQAQDGTIEYFSKDLKFNQQIPTPEQFMGHEVGEWHATPDKIYYYMLELARVSERAIWEGYGRSHESRPLGQLIISSPENIKRLETIRQQNLLLCDPEQSPKLDTRDMPLIVKLGYGVHGNEASSHNASLLVSYYLAAGEDEEIQEILENTVALINPCINPDGMQRFSTWVNSVKSSGGNPDPNSWEFNEPWPGGRTNHYWFDLNRDWLALQQPESVGRAKAYYRWRPAIVTDHHEMQAYKTFFFSPGISGGDNPLVPEENRLLTGEIARYHEQCLDEVPTLYFSGENFDGFYPGKGATFPDIHGSIGILFEQAGVKGHLRETASGLKTFPDAIRNQFTVSLSTLKAGVVMREKLLDNQRKFYVTALEEADKKEVKAYVFSEPEDKARVSNFIRTLLMHHIKIFELEKNITLDGEEYKAGESYIIHLKQPESRFIESLFEPVFDFTDSTFYDVSTWVLPMAFNIPYTKIIGKKPEGLIGKEITLPPGVEGELLGPDDAYAYIFGWEEYYAPKALFRLQNAGLKVKVNKDKLVVNTGSEKKEFSYGSIMVTSFDQPMASKEIHNLMETTARECGIKIFGVESATQEGSYLGGNSFVPLKKPGILMLAGSGLSSSETGEIWYMLDKKFNIPVTLITADKIGKINLSRYNTLIVAGNPDVSEAGIEDIKSWNEKGSVIIAYGKGNTWLSKNKLAEIEFKEQNSSQKQEVLYIDKYADRKAKQVTGAIFETRLDLTHPLCYGYSRNTLPVMKVGTSVSCKDPDIYNNPVVFTGSPLLSGYCPKQILDSLKNNPFASFHGNGVISIYGETNFRGFWYGTEKIFLNAIFFGQII